MRRLLVLVFLVFLISCSVRPPLEEPIIVEDKEDEPMVEVEPVLDDSFDDVAVTKTVRQEHSGGATHFGLTDDNRLASVKRTGEDWEYKYEQGRLVEITGPENIEFFYRQGLLDSIDLGSRKLRFIYGVRDRLQKIEGGQYTIYIDYDSYDRPSAVRRGISGKTDIDYKDDNRFESISRGPKIMNVYYDEKDRLRGFDGDDTHFIMGYWKDDKLVSLSGKTFGTGLMASYGPDLPPTESLIVHADDDSRFVASYTDTIYAVTDLYLYCKYIRRLKSVPFEGQSYAFYATYFNGTIADYFKMNYVCLPLEN